MPFRQTRKWPTCGARVKTSEPSTPVEVSTSDGRSALSAFGFWTSVLYASAAPRYATVGLAPSTGPAAGSSSTRSAR